VSFAPQLREDLRGLGVDIIDREKTWFVSRANDLPSARHAPRPPPGPPPRPARGSGATRVASGGPSLVPGVSPSEQHDYVCGSDTVELRRVDLGAVHAVLAQRLAAKKRGHFELSDQLRGTLNALGVEVFDREKIWRVLPPVAPPPGRSRDAPPQFESRGGDKSRNPYTRDAGDSAWVDLMAVDALLLERMSAKFNRDFEKADTLREVRLTRSGRCLTVSAAPRPEAGAPSRNSSRVSARPASPIPSGATPGAWGGGSRHVQDVARRRRRLRRHPWPWRALQRRRERDGARAGARAGRARR